MNFIGNKTRRLLDAEISVPPSYGNRTRASTIDDANFDTNMVIILAALLCALIFALGLNSIVRCALRCTRRFSSEAGEQGGGRRRLSSASTGLKKKELSQIPVAEYGSSGVEIPVTECPICLGEFQEGEKVRMLPKCHHGFHVRCIDTWLLSHSSCPNCRHSLLDLPPSPPTPTPPPSNSNPNPNQDRVLVVVDHPSEDF